ncbi:MAG: MarC family transcriptional regulator [Chloroflexi bacterium RBG_16_57_8]|nr:MAG: MarC family transcriptional regulator [Chloroflexi bacterium RBG_16_57_8]
MPGFWESFVLTFVPLFIVVDAIGNLPFLVSVTEGISVRERRRMIHLAVITAAIVGLAFLFFGRLILNALRIEVGEFAIAGGVILFVLSVRYMLTGHFGEVGSREEMAAVVPIGTPMVVGPATITTLLFLTDVERFPLYIVLISFVLNMIATWLVFMLGSQFVRFLGRGGLRAVSRVFNLILAAIAVSMIVRGLGMLGIISLQQ